MKRLGLHLVFVLLVAATCFYLVYPPKEKLRLGRDLRGGVSLVYSVQIPEGADSVQVVKDVITVLQDRANPRGVFDISFIPQGYNRIEVVMPLPSPEVQAQHQAFRAALEQLVGSSRIDRDDVLAAAQAGNASARYGGSSEERKVRLIALEAAAQKAVDARTAIEAAKLAGDAAAERTATAQLAEAEVALEQGADVLAAPGVSERRMVRALSLPSTPRPIIDPKTRKPQRDESGNILHGPSERQEELDVILKDVAWLRPEFDRVVEAWNVFESRRTGLDSPDDLKRLFRGAGVLDFHIAVQTQSPEGVNPAELRTQLAERGPEGAVAPVARWFKVQDIKQWADTPELIAAARADPVAYFQSQRGLVAGVFEGETYLLMYTTDGRSMTHTPSRPWSMTGAGRTVDEFGRQAVSFALDDAGGALMRDLTSKNLGKPLSVLLDKQVYTAANINSTIAKSGIITGSFSDEDIQYLTRVLKAGALSGQLSAEPVSVNILGPALGADNLVRGFEAVVYSMIAVGILMLVYYLVAGVMAVVALAFIVLLTFGLMAFIDSTFTMPGLAGIALAVGMAVDANVLIYERIREELMINKEPLRTAARLGFARAFGAIFDGNVTNILVCVVLIYFAGAEVKGFGVTMLIGSAATLLGGVWLSRVLMGMYTDWMHAKKLPMITTVFPPVNRWVLPRVDWIRLGPAMLGISLILAIAGIGLTASRGGAMLDTEFRGGVVMTMSTKRVDTTPYLSKAGDTPSSIAEAIPGVPARAITELNPDVNFTALPAGTRLLVPTGPCSPDGRILLSRQQVEDKVHAAGDAADPGTVAGQFRNAAVLAMGEQTSDFKTSTFQIKIGNPPGKLDETKITDEAVTTLATTMRDQLDGQASRTFKGAGEGHRDFTFLVDKKTIGETIGRPEITDPVGRLRGGAAIVLEDVNPPITLDEARARLARMRTQPDFSDVAGRETRIIGLDPVDAADPEKGYSAIAVLVNDPAVNRLRVPFETWDERLAHREWELVNHALGQATALDQVSSFSPSVAQSLLANAVIAVLLSLILLLGYIWIRFGSLRYSVGTILALTFNICATLGFLALTPWLATTGFGASLGIHEFRIDLNVIAGLLAVTGYNINDTIVILDRVRERRGRQIFATKRQINDAVNQTFSRTLLTSATTISSALILVIFGGESIRAFSMTLLVGTILGHISSITVAVPLAYAGRKAEEAAVPSASASGTTALAHPV